jgi:predicted nucleic acid-binding protein
LFDRINGVMGVIQFLDALQLFNPTIEHMNRADLRRAREIMERFKDARQLDFVDCCIVAIAERVETDLVCTFDYRDFQIVRMKNNQPMNILPTPNSRA